MAITLHTVDTNAGTVQRVWQHERTCPAGGSFDLVVPNALAVSRKVRAQRLTAPLHVLRPQRHLVRSAHSATPCAACAHSAGTIDATAHAATRAAA